MTEETNKGYDLTKAGPLVVERFDEATARDETEDDNICILHGLEKAMIGTAEVGDHTVAVYERSLCIQCIADGFTDEDMKNLYKDEYSEEELNNPDLLQELKLKDAEEFLSIIPSVLSRMPTKQPRLSWRASPWIPRGGMRSRTLASSMVLYI